MGSLTVVVLTFAVLIPICFGGPAYHEGHYKKKYSHDMSYDKKGYKKYDDYDKKPSYPRGFGRRGDVQLARDLVLLKMAMDMYGGKHDDHGYGYDYKKKDYKKKDYDYDYKKKDYDYNDYKKKDDYNDYDKKDYKKKDYGASNSYQYGGPGHFGGPGGGPGFHGGHWGGPFGGGPGFSGGAAGRFGGQFHHPHGQWVCKCKPYCNMFNEINAGVCPKFPIWKICCKWIPIKPHKPYDKKYDDKKYDDKHYHKKYDDKKYDNKHHDKKYDDKKYDDKKYDKKYYGSGHQHHYGHGPGYSGYQSSYGPGYGRYQSSYGPGYGGYQSSYGPGYSGGLSSSYKSTYGSTYARPY